MRFGVGGALGAGRFGVLFLMVWANGQLAAAQPILAEAPQNRSWAVTTETTKAVFVGDERTGDPQIVLRRSAVAGNVLYARIASDARQCVLRSANVELPIPTVPRQDVQLALDGRPDQPRLAVDRAEPASLQADWQRLIAATDDPNITITLVGATYATLWFTQGRLPDAVAAESPDGLSGPAPPQAGVVRQHLRMPVVQSELTHDGEPNWIPFLSAGIDFTNAYYYHGIGQDNSDMIVQPRADVTLNVIQGDEESWLDGIDLKVGARSSHHFGDTGRDLAGGRDKFYELDFIGGFAVRAFDAWTFDLAYVNRVGTNDQLNDVHQIELRITFDDGDPNYPSQWWPYALVVFEAEGESDAGNDPPHSDLGTYLELGVRPSLELLGLGPDRSLTLAFPVSVGLSLENYYEDPSGDDDVFGFVDLGCQLRCPLIVARAGGDRRCVVDLVVGTDVLILGNSLRDLNAANGTGDGSVQLIGKVGFDFRY